MFLCFLRKGTRCDFTYFIFLFAGFGLGPVNVNNLIRGPSMTSEPVNVIVLSYGYDVFFECVASSNPIVNYTWTKDNTVLTAAMDTRYSSSLLI